MLDNLNVDVDTKVRENNSFVAHNDQKKSPLDVASAAENLTASWVVSYENQNEENRKF